MNEKGEKRQRAESSLKNQSGQKRRRSDGPKKRAGTAETKSSKSSRRPCQHAEGARGNVLKCGR